MTKLMDYMISPYPIRIIDSKVEPSRLRLNSIRIGQAGHLPGRTLFRSAARFEHWALVYIVSGGGTFKENDGKEQQVREGSLFFFRPGFNYDFGPSPGGNWDEYYISFGGSRVAEWTETGLISGGTVYQANTVQGLSASFEEVLGLIDGGAPEDADRGALLLEGMLLEISLHLQGNNRAGQQDAMALIREALNACIYEQPDLPAIAGSLHISMSTLRRTVRRSSGYPLHEYIHRLKMAEAKHLLLNTSLQVQEIAGMLHYKDSFYFSRLFKKYMGFSPQRSRNNV